MASHAPPQQPAPASKPVNPYLAMANFEDLDVPSPKPASAYRMPEPPPPPQPQIEAAATAQDSQMPTAPAPETVQQIVESQSHADPVEAHVDRVEKQAEEVRKEIEADKKAMKAPAPPVESTEPVAVTGKLDSDADLADIQQHNPMAYGIVKALLLKKSMGLVKDGPAPESESSEASELMAEADEPEVPAHHAPKDMFAWRPQDSASDLLPGAADAPAEPAASAPEPASDDQGLSSWLGTSSVLSKATASAPAPAPAAGDALSMWHPEAAMIAVDPGNDDSSPAAAAQPVAPVAPAPIAPRLPQTSGVLNQFMSDLD
jgi:hypothetical protein